MRDSPKLHWSTQAGTSSSVRDPYPARGLILHRRPLSGLPPHARGERRIKRWGDCGRYRHRCRAWHQKQRQSGTEMPKFCLGNYAFFGVGEPAPFGEGPSQYLAVLFVIALNASFRGLQRPSVPWHGNAQGRTRFALSRALRACPGLCRAHGVDGCLSTWSAAPRCCTHGHPWSSWQGSHRARIQTGGIPLRASCPAAC